MGPTTHSPDPTRLREVYHAHAATLLLYARTWRTGAEAEDLVQEAFVRLLSQTAIPAEPRAWLFTVVRNLALSGVRARRSATAHAAAGTPQLFCSAPTDLVSTAEVQAIVGALPAGEREIVVMRIWGGLTFEQIGSVTGRSLSSVFRSYRECLARIRAKLEKPCPTNP